MSATNYVIRDGATPSAFAAANKDLDGGSAGDGDDWGDQNNDYLAASHVSVKSTSTPVASMWSSYVECKLRHNSNEATARMTSNHCGTLRLVALLCWVLCRCIVVEAYQQCSEDQGGGICPDGNTCCRFPNGSSGCIASDMGGYNATCCCIDGTETTVTGCGVGYECRTSDDRGGYCVATNASPLADPLVYLLPRYQLCQSDEIRNVHGLPVRQASTSLSPPSQLNHSSTSKLAYYSSHGPIESISASLSFDMVFIFIHGALRNADDYFCAAKKLAEIQTSYDNVLVVSPRFLGDSDQARFDDSSFLYWEDKGSGPWRYGADSISTESISSFHAFDTLVDTILQKFPSVELFSIAGHSSGGQFVQRWSLLTSYWDTDRMRSIVANPSSYAYLTSLRFIDGRWQEIQGAIKEGCPHYNQWEWGLDPGGELEVPYRKAAFTNASYLIERFNDRSVTYLSGSVDRCNVSDPNGWCHSHGLETNCVDELQGSNRLERAARYMAMLRLVGIGPENHVRYIVNGVGHDHTLMFQSEVGIAAVFGRSPSFSVGDEWFGRTLDTQ